MSEKDKISFSPSIPPAVAENVMQLIDSVSGLVIQTDEDANVMAQMLREVVTRKHELTEWIKPTKQAANAAWKAMIDMEKDILCGLDACEGMAREKIASHCEEQFALAEEALKDGEVPSRIMPKLDGVSVRDKLKVTVVDSEAVVDWLIDNGYKSVLTVPTKELTKIVELRSAHMDVPGVNVEKRVSLAVRKER
jgi:hypothetical protein